MATPLAAALLIVAVAVATRIVAWWNPVAHVDDQFYLLAGEELLKGHWPYVDVWDRKPLGLFLLYAGIAWIGDGSILGLNLVATAFAAATAWVIRQISLRFAGPTGATLAALAYLLVIPLLGGQNGQSPVFYNLLMALAAKLLIDAATLALPQPIVRRALGSMLLCGVAMTIKQISFIEGAYFGLAYLWLMHRRGMPIAKLVAVGCVMIIVALLPTALTLAGYALAGLAPFEAYVTASFISIFQKGGWGAGTKLYLAFLSLLYLLPLLVTAVAGAAIRRQRLHIQIIDGILAGWIAAALFGDIAVPHFFDHYALPLAIPLSVSAATLFEQSSGKLFFSALTLFCVMQTPIRDYRSNARARVEYDRLSDAVDGARQGGCIYVADGSARLYSTTRACRTTRFLFPEHLNLTIEADAVGIDVDEELRRILRQRPAVIVTRDKRMYRYSPAYFRFLDQLHAGYHSTYVVPPDARHLVQSTVVWQRNDLARPAS